MGTIYDENGGKYEVNDNYLLPCLTIGSTGKNEIGVWSQKHNLSEQTVWINTVFQTVKDSLGTP